MSGLFGDVKKKINYPVGFYNSKSCSKNTKYSRNETILKIGHHSKPIAFAKSLLWVKN